MEYSIHTVMNNIANKAIVLKLNSNWQTIGYGTVADAIVDLVAGESIKTLDIQYPVDENGNPDRSVSPSMIPVDWETWITLPIRPWDDVIHSAKLSIRVPTVVIAKNYSKMPMKSWKGKPSKEAIFIRDGGKCQYTGKTLDKKEATIDHVLPKSRGGNDDWTNLALTSKSLNGKKGNSLNNEIGLKLIRQPFVPRPIPVSQLIREAKHPDWLLFINPA
jgi:5-methylcytosine-specific restriction endonuclease McrA